MKFNRGKLIGICFIFSVTLLRMTDRATAQGLNSLERIHDVIIVTGAKLVSHLGKPISMIRVFRYSKSTDLWEPIPFQVDELDGGSSYFGDKNGILDETDEIVFLVRDLGDSASVDMWLGDDEARSNVRYRVSSVEPFDSSQKGWATIYLSSTLPKSPERYIEYDIDSDQIETESFTLSHGGSSGFQEFLSLKTTAGGDGIDFLDRQKLRLKVKIDLGILGKVEFVIKEEMDQDIEIALGAKIHLRVRRKQVDIVPGCVVRLHRKMVLGARANGSGIDIQYDFPFTTAFYPTYVEWKTDAFEIPNFGGMGKIEEIRFSTDLNKNSVGMMLYNSTNPEGIRIDGLLSIFNDHLDWPGQNWYLIVADPAYNNAILQNASIVTLMELKGVPMGDSHRFFFQDFSIWSSSGDTGDKKSYGDTGIKVEGNNITGVIDYYNASYFIPANLDTTQARDIFRRHCNPLLVSSQEEQPQYAQIIVDTEPSGLLFLADGIERLGPFTFVWLVGSFHTISVDSVQGELNGSRFVFSSWSDGGDLERHIVVQSNGENFIALFKTQYYLTTAESPENAGNMIPSPPGAWFDDRTLVRVKAESSIWYTFLNWSGDLSGTDNPDSLMLDSPKIVTAHFGNYPPVVDVPDTTFAEDDTLILDYLNLLQWIKDENNPDSTLSIIVTGGNQLEVKRDSLNERFLVFSDQMHWNGVDTITITVTDPLNAPGYDGMAMTVIPVPDPPESFSLTTPANETSFSEWPDILDFSWEPSTDPDEGDKVTYIFELDSTIRFDSSRLVRVDSLETTGYVFPWPDSYGDGTYYWRVEAIDRLGHFTWSNEEFNLNLETGIIGGIPISFVLAQNYPNPFNDDTTIRYGLLSPDRVLLIIYNSQGRRVKTMVDGWRKKGYHTAIWNGRDDHGQRVSSGLYFILFQGNFFKFVKKALLLR